MFATALFGATCGALLFLGILPPPIFVNDAFVDRDCFTQRPGNDATGDGSSQRPYATIEKALEVAVPGQTIYIDAGRYSSQKSPELGQFMVRIVGTPNRLTRLRVEEGPVMRIVENEGILLRDLVLEGGSSGLELIEVTNSLVERVISFEADTYGILLRDCKNLRLIGCMTVGSKFRGLQVDRCSGLLIENHFAAQNGKSGVVLRNSHQNVLRRCRSEENGMSGFFLSNASTYNEIWDCLAIGNKLVGFYLFQGSTGNALRGNTSQGNERGITAAGSPQNRFDRNTVVGNRTYGFLFKDDSPGNQLARNRAEDNPSGDLASSPDSPSNITFRNQIGRTVVYSPPR